MTMFYNADMLKAAGFDAAPKTAEEFDAMAAAMTAGDNKGFDITGGFPVQQIFQQMLHQFGGTEFSADGTQATWNSEAGVKALQWMRDVQAKYSHPNLEVDAELNAFKAGTVGMVWNGIWQTSNVTGAGVEFTGVAAAVPQIGPQIGPFRLPNRLFVAPMAGVTDRPFRQLCRSMGAGLAVSEMVTSNSLLYGSAKTRRRADHEGEAAPVTASPAA